MLTKDEVRTLRGYLKDAQTLGEAGAPPWQDLPWEVPPDLPDAFHGLFGDIKEDCIPLRSMPSVSDVESPLSEDVVRITPENLGLHWYDVFINEEWACLPHGKKIKRTRNHGMETWEYPTMTSVLHRFRLKTAKGPQNFEIRLGVKQRSEKWSFGLYYSTRNPGSLKLNTQEDVHEPPFPVTLEDGRRVKVEIARVNPSFCHHCHLDMSNNDYWQKALRPEQSEGYAGPCRFTPNQKYLLEDWSRDFQKKYGYCPFDPCPPQPPSEAN